MLKLCDDISNWMHLKRNILPVPRHLFLSLHLLKVKHLMWSNKRQKHFLLHCRPEPPPQRSARCANSASSRARHIMNIPASLRCSTLSILCSFNKHIHAEVVLHPAPIQHLRGSSVSLRRWFSQPLTGGSLWTSEHIRRQTQEPSARIMSDHSEHDGHGIHFLPSLFWLCPSPSTLSHTRTHFTHLQCWLHNRAQEAASRYLRPLFAWIHMI